MELDAVMHTSDINTMAATAECAEQTGLGAVWTTETKHDPFLPLVPAALATTRLKLGTAVALAFTRSPTTVAHTAWDLARASHGRFILGLGTQVKAHIERRFSSRWEAPVEMLRDYIGAMRAVWQTWRTGERLRYTGRFYDLRLMTPFFSPDPLPYPNPPIFIAGVNSGLCRLAGEVCQGFHVHPLHTRKYLQSAILPWIEEGLAISGRSRGEIEVSANVFLIVGKGADRDQMRREVKSQIAFYASTPSYSTLLEMEGWGSIGAQLGNLARRGRWEEMGALVTDEMLAELALEGETLADAAIQLRKRYAGLLQRASFYIPFVPGERDEDWQAAAGVISEEE